MKKFIQIDGWYLFYVLVLFYALYQFALNNFLFTSDLVYQSYEEMLPLDSINSLVEFRERFFWVGYLLIFLSIPLKAGYTAACVNTGTILAGFDFRYKDIFKSALIAEYVFVFAAIIQFSWTLIMIRPETIQETATFYPLSLAGLLSPQEIPAWLQNPLQRINLFEVVYAFILTGILREFPESKGRPVAGTAIVSYIVGSLLVIVLMTFLSIQTG